MVTTDLDASLTICRTLTRVIQDAFGPHGKKSMITTVTGKVLVSSDGSAILRSLNLSHPMAKVITTSAMKNADVTGSGCKTFMLYLTGALEKVYQLTRKYCWQGKRSSEAKSFVLHLSNSVRKLINDHLAVKLMHGLTSSKISEHYNLLELRKITEYLLYTELSSLLSTFLAEHFAHILAKYLTEHAKDDKDVIRNAQLVADNFHDLRIKLDGQGYKESCVSEGILINRNMTVHPTLPLKSSVKFIILRCSLDAARDSGMDSHRVQVQCEDILEKSLDQKQQKFEHFLTFCRKYEIGLIFSSEKIINSFVQKCAVFNIGVVEYLPDSDIDRLASFCNVVPVYRICEIGPDNIGQALSINTSIYGHRKYVEIRQDAHITNIVDKQIVVCAPSEGLCDEICSAVHKAVKTLSLVQTRKQQSANGQHLNISEDVQHIDTFTCATNRNLLSSVQSNHETAIRQVCVWEVIQGGGTFEMFTENFLNQVISENNDDMLRMACEVVKRGVLEVPKTLHRNLNHRSAGNCDRSFLTLHKQGCDELAWGECVGFDINDGELKKLQNVLEPISCKICVLLKALQLLCQILRTDSIVGVSRSTAKIVL